MKCRHRHVTARVMRARLGGDKHSCPTISQTQNKIKKKTTTMTKNWLHWTNGIAKNKRKVKILMLLLLRWTTRDKSTRQETYDRRRQNSSISICRCYTYSDHLFEDGIHVLRRSYTLLRIRMPRPTCQLCIRQVLVVMCRHASLMNT